MELTQSLEVRIPAKVMLVGEYVIGLPSGEALALALNLWMTLTMRRSSGGSSVFSSLWQKTFRETHRGWEDEFSLKKSCDEPLLDALESAKLWVKTRENFTIDVRSQWDGIWGLGSSSAVRMGIFRAMEALCQVPYGGLEWDYRAWECQNRYQGWASGYDILTQKNGGLVLCENLCGKANLRRRFPIPKKKILWVMAGGVGAPTRATISRGCEEIREKKLEKILMLASETLLKIFLRCLGEQGSESEEEGLLWELAVAMGEHRKILEELSIFPAWLKSLKSLAGCDKTWSFKTTGSGGEDVLLLVGERREVLAPMAWLKKRGWFLLQVDFTNKGCEILWESWPQSLQTLR